MNLKDQSLIVFPRIEHLLQITARIAGYLLMQSAQSTSHVKLKFP